MNGIQLLITLPSTTTAPRQARNALDRIRGELGLAYEDVTLAVSELVANSVRHAELDSTDLIEVWVSPRDDSVRIEVADPGVGFQHDDVSAGDSGFGLQILGHVARDWGASSGERVVVWAEIPVARPSRAE